MITEQTGKKSSNFFQINITIFLITIEQKLDHFKLNN